MQVRIIFTSDAEEQPRATLARNMLHVVRDQVCLTRTIESRAVTTLKVGHRLRESGRSLDMAFLLTENWLHFHKVVDRTSARLILIESIRRWGRARLDRHHRQDISFSFQRQGDLASRLLSWKLLLPGEELRRPTVLSALCKAYKCLLD